MYRSGSAPIRADVDLPCQSKVADLGNPLRGQQHIGGLQIAVDDLLRMGMGDGTGQAADKRGGRQGGLRFPRNPLVEVSASDVLLDDIGSSLMGSPVENLHDVRMLEPAQGLRLGSESRPASLRRRQLRLQELESNAPSQTDLFRKVNQPHPPPTAFRDEDEPRRRRHGRVR